MSDSRSWAADQDEKEERREIEQYKQTARYQAMAQSKKDIETLWTQPIKRTMSASEIAFVLERCQDHNLDYSGRRHQERFYTQERYNKLRDIVDGA